MSRIFSAHDPNDLEEMSAERWKILRAATLAVGMQIGALVMSDDDNDEDAPGVIMLALPPGGKIGRHAHDCHRVEVVVSGTLDVGGGRVLEPGDVMVTRPGQFYGPHYAGPEGSLTVEIFSRSAGFSTIADPDGEPADAERSGYVNDAIARARSFAD